MSQIWPENHLNEIWYSSIFNHLDKSDISLIGTFCLMKIKTFFVKKLSKYAYNLVISIIYSKICKIIAK